MLPCFGLGCFLLDQLLGEGGAEGWKVRPLGQKCQKELTLGRGCEKPAGWHSRHRRLLGGRRPCTGCFWVGQSQRDEETGLEVKVKMVTYSASI